MIDRQGLILRQIRDERDRQDAKFGDQWEKDYAVWFAILGEEFGEVAKVVCELLHARDLDAFRARLPELREELIQTAAVAVAFLEHGDRNHWWEEGR